MGKDLRFAIHVMRTNTGSMALALGIGANTAIFSLINAKSGPTAAYTDFCEEPPCATTACAHDDIIDVAKPYGRRGLTMDR